MKSLEQKVKQQVWRNVLRTINPNGLRTINPNGQILAEDTENYIPEIPRLDTPSLLNYYGPISERPGFFERYVRSMKDEFMRTPIIHTWLITFGLVVIIKKSLTYNKLRSK